MSRPPSDSSEFQKPPLFDLRMSLIFAALFVPMGIYLPYFPLWLEDNGFGAGEIAVILSAPMFLRVFTTPFLSAIADGASDRAHVLIACSVAAFVLSLGYFPPPSYVLVLGVSLALAVVWAPQVPIADSIALSGVRRFGSDYSRLRIWGSISFLVANLAGGVVLGASGAGSVLWMFSIGLSLTLAAAIAAPRLGRPRRASPLSAEGFRESGVSLLNRRFLLFIAACGLIQASHGFMFAFVSIYWKSLGIGETLVGFLWAWAVVAEVMVFMAFRRYFSSISAPMLLALAAMAAAVRWCAFPLVWPLGAGVPGFFAVQALHAFSTGFILLGLQKMIAESVPDAHTGAAQGLGFFANNFAMAAVTLASGPLYAALGANGFYAMAVVALAGLGLILGQVSPRARARAAR